MGECLYCRGKGTLDGCPKCGKKMSFGGAGAVEVTAEILEKFTIPAEYLQTEWDDQVLLEDHPTKIKNKSFQRYMKELGKLMEIFRSGLPIKQSAIILAPRRYGKQTFANCCLKEALAHGFSILPILDNTQIKRINVLSADRPATDYMRLSKYTIEDLTQADICFMTIDADNFRSAFRTIDSLMDKRARMGKPTFVLSRFTLQDMSDYDSRKAYLGLVDKHRTNNHLRYPVIVNALSILTLGE